MKDARAESAAHPTRPPSPVCVIQWAQPITQTSWLFQPGCKDDKGRGGPGANPAIPGGPAARPTEPACVIQWAKPITQRSWLHQPGSKSDKGRGGLGAKPPITCLFRGPVQSVFRCSSILSYLAVIDEETEEAKHRSTGDNGVSHPVCRCESLLDENSGGSGQSRTATAEGGWFTAT